jgi:SecDF, P1 head subdomain
MDVMKVALLFAVGCASIGLACRSAANPATSGETGAEEPSGYELLYRKPSGEPFTSAEVEQLGAVLRKRVQAAQPVWGVSAMVGADHLLHVEMPNAPSAEAIDALRPKLELGGQLTFEGIANESTPGWDAVAEHKRLRAWWEAQRVPSLEQYNALAPDQGGPPAFIRWRELRSTGALPVEQRLASFLPCIRMEVLHADRDWMFGSSDVGKVDSMSDVSGFPAIGFEMTEARKQAFGQFTGAYVGHQIAMVMDGVVISAPLVRDALLGASMIAGRFEEAEVEAMIAALNSGPLPTRLEFVALRPMAAR